MSFQNITMLIGGLALFLYGMHMMSEGLEIAAGNRMKQILEKLTSNRFIGVAVGALVTAAIQSSSAMTVMVVGFVNSSLMSLEQAVWLIMGANVGTTITGQLIALDVSKIASIIAIAGVCMVTFMKNKKVNCIGEIIGGLGILFIGMGMMSDAMIPLRDNAAFIHLMTTFSNPLIGILAGAAFTALIQSSSASVGILQALAMSGVIPLESAIFVLFGQNIGTCITAVLASLNANRNAKRTTIIHLSFNIIGTAIFVAVAMMVPYADFIRSISGNAASQIANAHTIFNITTTLLLLPFGAKLAELSRKILPLHDNEKPADYKLALLNDMTIGSLAVAISSLRSEIATMLHFTKTNLDEAFESILKKDKDHLDSINEMEETINNLNYEITHFVEKASSMGMNLRDSQICNALFKVSCDIERIGDHALNIGQYASTYDLHKELNDAALEELRELHQLMDDSLENLFKSDFVKDEQVLDTIQRAEETSDVLTYKYRQRQISRLMHKECSADNCVIYSEIMTDIERIFDHILNITQECYHARYALEGE